MGPDYKEPQADWLVQWQPELYPSPTGSSVNADLSQWWTRFNDPVLNDLIVKARTESPGLKIAGLRILESRALAGVASGAQYPQVQQLTAQGAYAGKNAVAVSTAISPPARRRLILAGKWIFGGASAAGWSRPTPLILRQ